MPSRWIVKTRHKYPIKHKELQKNILQRWKYQGFSGVLLTFDFLTNKICFGKENGNDRK